MASVFKRGGKGNRGGSYYVSWCDHTGKRQTKSAKTTDKATAERIVAKHEADAALRRAGVIDPALDAIAKESQRSVESHLADYKAKLQAAGRAETHVADTTRYIRFICDAEGFDKAADIAADGVNHYANELKSKGRSARTQQAYLTAIKAFSRWLADGHKLPRDPLSSVRKPNPKSDRRLERRMLLPDEWTWLRSVTLGKDVKRYGMLPGERVLLYGVAIETGLRAAELRSLRRGRLYLDGSQPYVTCKAGSTKNRGPAKQYIRPALAEELSQHAANKAPGAAVFAMPPKEDTASMLRDDLADARRAWVKAAVDSQERLRRDQSDFLVDVNHEGEVLDFHSLRHTTGAWLAMVGEHPKVIQTIMRHSTITLTMDTYGHLIPGSEADAVVRLDDLFDGEREPMQATGTNDAAVLPMADAERPKSAGGAQRRAQRAGRETMPTGCEQTEGSHPAGRKKKVRLNRCD